MAIKNKHKQNNSVRKKRYWVFILGAGFSRPAGLPLGDELFREILKRKNRRRSGSFISGDLDRFVEYKKKCGVIELTHENINYEEFISFLDIEHYLGLKGSDTWSHDGNESQIAIKYLIGEIINERTPKIEAMPDFYFEFVKRLKPGDIIITFNYDLILEMCLSHIGKDYRLYPYPTSEQDVSDDFDDQVIILKMHGSIDWFSSWNYEEQRRIHREDGFPDFESPDPIFDKNDKYKKVPILNDTKDEDNPLSKIFRIKEVRKFYSENNEMLATPWILSPSYHKILYAKTLRDFWYGIYEAGSWNYGVGIIGFSLPPHDEYIRQIIYTIVRNYQESEEYGYGEKHLSKAKFKMVDFCENDKDLSKLKKQYCFVDWNQADLYVKGFGEEAVKLLFDCI